MDPIPINLRLVLEQCRSACKQAAIDAYEDAALRGLCPQGAFEVAMQAIDAVPLQNESLRGSNHLTAMHDLFIQGWRRVGHQARTLLQDVDVVHYVHQPDGVINHPAWTLSHLVHYHPAILCLVQGLPVVDPATAPGADLYDEGSTPQPNASLYPPGDKLLATYLQGHEQISAALQDAPPQRFEQKPGLDRWANSFPVTADLLVYLMLIHESQHLGQLMVWRCAMKLA